MKCHIHDIEMEAGNLIASYWICPECDKPSPTQSQGNEQGEAIFICIFNISHPSQLAKEQ